jgi:nitroreductase
MRTFFKKVKEKARLVLVSLKLISNGRLPWLVHLYEHRWKYQGEALFHGIRQNVAGGSVEYNFRRNIHRLEKGLSNASLRSVFAEKYIFETVKLHRVLRASACPEKNTLKWGEAVLAHYFSRIQHTPVIKRAYEYHLESKPENPEPTWFPYSIEKRPESTVDYSGLYDLARRRRSVRMYQDKPVDYALIRKAMAIASQSPSACNRQPFRFLYYDDPKVVHSIAQIPIGASGLFVPGMLVVVGSYGAYFDERDLNCPIIDSSLAVMSFLLALETEGLSSVCINWPNLPEQEKQIRRIIQFAPDEFIVLLIGVGYAAPNALIPFSAKKDIDELIQHNPRLIAGYQGESSGLQDESE